MALHMNNSKDLIIKKTYWHYRNPILQWQTQKSESNLIKLLSFFF